MKLKIDIETDDDAATMDTEGEIVRILRGIAHQIEEGDIGGYIHDLNGNRIGNWDKREEVTA